MNHLHIHTTVNLTSRKWLTLREATKLLIPFSRTLVKFRNFFNRHNQSCLPFSAKPSDGFMYITSSNSPWRKLLLTSNCSISKSLESTIYNMILTEDMLNNCGKYLIVVNASALEKPFVTSLDLHGCLYFKFLLYTHLHPMIFTFEALVQCSMCHSLLVRTSHLL